MLSWLNFISSTLLLLLLVSQINATETESAPLPIPPRLPSQGTLPPQDTLPFGPGERLVYEVRYLGVRTGTAVLEVLDAIALNGQEVYPLVSTAQSGDFASVFYPVNDRVESTLNTKGLYSESIKVSQHEGKQRREKQVAFNQVEHKAIQVEDGERKVFDIPPNVNDSLSSLYIFRTATLTVGSSVFIDVHESGKNWKLEVAVLGKETVTTPIGTFDTIKVQATPRYEALFLSKGSITIWVTDDDKKIPVLMKSKIKIGSITATLVSRRDGDGGGGLQRY